MAILSNFDTALEATETALNSTGSAARENAAYMDSLAAKTTALESSFQQLSNNLASSDLVGTILDIANAFLQLANTDLGKIVTQVALLSGLGWGITSLIRVSNIIPNIITQFTTFGKILTNLPTYMRLASDSGLTLNRTIQIMTGSTATLSSVALPVITIISTIITLIGHFKQAAEEARQEALNNANAYLEQADSMETLKQEYIDILDNTEDEAEKNQKLADFKKKLIEQYGFESAAIDEVNGKRQAMLDLLDEESAADITNAWAEIQDQYEDAVEYMSEGFKKSFKGSLTGLRDELRFEFIGMEGTLVPSQEELDTLKEYGIILQDVGEGYFNFGIDQNAFTTVDEAVTQLNGGLLYLKQLLAEDPNNYVLQSVISGLDATIDDLNENIDDNAEAYDTGTKALTEYLSLQLDNNKLTLDNVEYVIDSKESYDELTEAIQNSNLDIQVQNNLLEELKNLYPDYSTNVLDAAASTDTFNTAMANLNARMKEFEPFNFADSAKEIQNVFNDLESDIENFGAVSTDVFNNLSALIPNINDPLLTAKLNIDGLEGSLFNADGTISDTGITALSAAGSFESLAKAILQAQISINTAQYENLRTELTAYQQSAEGYRKVVIEAAQEFGTESEVYRRAVLNQAEQQAERAETANAMADLQRINKELQAVYDSFDTVFAGGFSSGGGGASSVRDQAEETKDILADLKAWLENKDHQIFLLESQQQVAEDQELLNEAERFANERAQIIQNNMAVLHNWANALRDQGYAEDSDYIKELQELWWQYKNELDDIYDDIDARREESQKAELDRINELREKRLQTREDALSKEKEAYEALANYMVDRIDEEMAAIDAEIDALDKQNDKLEDQIALEEKLDALARAKSQRVMVYKDGRFQYVSDVDAVSEAQADLDEYNREQALQAQKDALEAEKDILQQYKDEWSSLTQKYQEEQDKLLLEEYFGINAENDNWKERLDNFQDFYDEYAKICEDLAALQEKLQQDLEELYDTYNTITNILNKGPSSIGSGIASGITSGIIASGGNPIWGAIGGIFGGALGAVDAITGGSSNKGSSSSSSSSGTITSDKGYTIGSDKGKDFVDSAPAGSTMTGGDGSKWTKNPDGSTTIVDKDGVKHTVSSNKRASGVLSNPTDSIDLVGEEGPEMRFNPKGAGIVPTNMTKNLWAWGTTNPSQYLNTISGVGTGSGQSTAITIQNFNPSLPNVSNGEDFVNYLNTSFVRHVVQYTTKR